MLTHLSLRHFATVEQLTLEPKNGLTVISGETGAGKSIIIDALGLALGDRADAAMVRAGTERAEVEVTFDLADCPAARAWLAERELDEDDDCIIRRTIRADGRSKAYLNGRPVTLSDLRELSEQLISIHSQHEHQALLKTQAQRALLDSFAGATELAGKTRSAFNAWRSARRAHEEALSRANEQDERQNLLRFQLEELDAFDLGEEELAQLEQEQKRLANADNLIRLCQQSVGLLYEGEDNTITGLLGQVSHWVTDASHEDGALREVMDTLESARIQVETAAGDLRHYLDRLELDPERLAQVEDRLGQAYTLARKHRVRPEELYSHHQALRAEAGTLDNLDDHLKGLEAAEKSARADFDKAAGALSERRRKKAKALAKGVMDHLKALGMKGAELDITLTDCEPSADGAEQVEFLFTANPGQPLRPLAKVASGGELSRVSLAIQVICAQTLTVPALVFDEVDVGVGGGVAEIVGRLLRQLGSHAQVLCITHQPQVASLGHHHWHVLKQQGKKDTRTEIINLDESRRVEEVARMLGGVEITDSTLTHAREMLQRSQTN
ncbi:MAG: DNA repair protein RecN [Alcanivoracaceae bacterium]|nr:DNA repair protein RecN [Alcanivoracaceae bacterium]